MDEVKSNPLAKLVWLDPYSGISKEFALRDGEKARIGRAASNEIQIAEGHVSRHHATVICENGQFTIDDVGSANGTFVNGVQVFGMNPLTVGDEVHLFVSALKLVASSAKMSGDAAELVTPVAGDRACLRVTQGPQKGQVFAFLKEELYIGRSTPNSNWEIALQDPTVSRPHAFLVKERHQWKLFDLGSINGTAVNNHPVTGGKAHNLRDGDRIMFGGTMTVFHTGFPARISTEAAQRQQ